MKTPIESQHKALRPNAGHHTATTPGPWAWTGNRLGPVIKDPAAGHVHTILDADGGYGYIHSKLIDTLAQLDADRRLIAAAPDLPAICQRLAESADYWSEYDVPIGIVADSKAAIARATLAQQSADCAATAGGA